MEFFREAPAGAIALVVIGAVLTFVVATPLQIQAARRTAARKKLEKETGAPAMIRQDDGHRLAFVVNAAGYVLMAIGFGIWIVS